MKVLTRKGGFRSNMHMVLWSPVGAPAGVPGPRRNADECDAGWFAPVATRRRPMLVGFQLTSPWLAVFSRGDTPRTSRSPCACGLATWGQGAGWLRGLEGLATCDVTSWVGWLRCLLLPRLDGGHSGRVLGEVARAGPGGSTGGAPEVCGTRWRRMARRLPLP